MTVNQKKEFKVPSDEAFGPTGLGALIPPDADLIFQVHLRSIDQPEEEPAVEEDSGEE
jgi:FKBP-type peptidyl-prolyl cis-trans isomerase